MKIINIDLISLPDIEGEFFFLDLVSKLEIKCQKILVSSWYAKLNWRNSHPRLEVEKVTLVDLWYNALAGEVVGCWLGAASYKGWRVEGGGVSRLLHFNDSIGGWNNFLLDLFCVSLSFLLFLCVFISTVALRRFTSWMKSFPENQTIISSMA